MGEEYYNELPYFANMPQYPAGNTGDVFDLKQYEQDASGGYPTNSFGYSNEFNQQAGGQ